MFTYNKRMLFLKLFSAVFLCFMFSSCVTSKNPLCDKKNSVLDSGLIGVWQGESEQVIISQAEGQLLFTEKDTNEKVKQKYTGYTAQIKSDNFLIIQGYENTAKDEYVFVHYVLSGNNVLTVYALNTEFFINAVEKQLIKGEIIKNKDWDKGVQLTDTTENMFEFLNKIDKKYYLKNEPGIYKKIVNENVKS
ncbi:secreted protein [Candidatus Omnitrophus magneticus]|uniref:Secreted protein n=1 Tax=Candidatus Omnitrophus magneticus TaxID=1609969 RepID=A0A0F0CSH0_9BACT|nr:secreted protein [Candidatus Omnitrophus magneticus]